MPTKHRVAGLAAATFLGGWIALITTNNAILVGERLEEPDTPALAVLLKGQWADGNRVDVKRLSLRCSYFNGSTLVHDVHKVAGPGREEGVSSCPTFRAKSSR